MKKTLLAAVVSIACTGAFAQTAPDPARGNTVTGPGTPSTTDKAASAGQANADARKTANPSAGTNAMKAPVPNQGTPSTTGRAETAGQANADARKANTGMAPMDANGDGMISKREYDRYHAGMWNKMKLTKGMVSQTEMQSAMTNSPP